MHNQINEPQSVADLVPYAYCCIAAAILILSHDFYLNRYKLSTIRILVVIAAIGCLSGGVFVIAGSYFHDKPHHVYLVNIGVSIWSIFLVKSADNIIFVMGYKYVNKHVSNWTYFLFFILIFSTIFASWFFGYSFAPFLINMNGPTIAKYLIRPCYIIYAVAGCICNVFFSYYFIQVIYEVNITRKLRIPKQAQLFAIRCALHGIASTIPIILAPLMENLPQENLNSAFVISISLHLLFNYKIERFFMTDSFRIWYMKAGKAIRELHLRGKKGTKKVKVAGQPARMSTQIHVEAKDEE